MAGRADGPLFQSRGAQLFIREGEESVLLHSGDFALVLVQNAASRLAAMMAMVGAVHWPVGRDCAVTRTGEASFSFLLPGPLCYALVLRDTSSSPADLQRLEKVLQDYTTYSAAHQQTAVVAAVGQGKEGLKQAGKGEEVCGAEGESRKRSGDDLSPEMEGRKQRARRISAIAKVFSKSLERGAINMANHVQPMDLCVPDSRSNPLDLALAGVDAVAKVVEAVENGGHTLLESALSTAATEPSSVQGSIAGCVQGASGLICTDWTLNKHGLLMLYRVITTSTVAMHSGLSSRSGSSRSGSSSSSEFRRLLSSSSSSSSSLSRELPGMLLPHTQAVVDSRRSDSMSITAMAAGAAPCLRPPPPPHFGAYTPRARLSNMPPPSCPMPPPPSGSMPPPPGPIVRSSSFRVYKPRPTPAIAPPAGPPPFPPRPPRSQPPHS